MSHITTEATLYPFSENPGEGIRSWVDAKTDEVMFDTPGTSMGMPRRDLSLHGLHNLYNSMAAGLSACLLNIKRDDIRRALADFEGVSHRLERIGTYGGLNWINDSKATNVNSCWYALESMPRTPEPKVVLILGGKDKGNDYSEILPLVQSKVKAIVCMGKDNEKLLAYFTGKVPQIVSTHSLDDAIAACRSIGTEGDTVLLSPCCASFDLFNSYEHRGDLFRQAVKSIQ